MVRPNGLVRWIFRKRLWRVRDSQEVFLTFDDGPTPALTRKLLSVLKRENVRATFFCVGENARVYPEILQEIADHGHRLGNHTMRHEKGSKTTREDYLKSVEEAAEFIDSDLFRPPYGRLPVNHSRPIRKKYTIVMWSWLSYDFDPDVPLQTIKTRAQSIRGGDILVLHDNEKVGDRVMDLLPEIIQIVKGKGLKFATLSA